MGNKPDDDSTPNEVEQKCIGVRGKDGSCHGMLTIFAKSVSAVHSANIPPHWFRVVIIKSDAANALGNTSPPDLPSEFLAQPPRHKKRWATYDSLGRLETSAPANPDAHARRWGSYSAQIADKKHPEHKDARTRPATSNKIDPLSTKEEQPPNSRSFPLSPTAVATIRSFIKSTAETVRDPEFVSECRESFAELVEFEVSFIKGTLTHFMTGQGITQIAKSTKLIGTGVASNMQKMGDWAMDKVKEWWN